MWHAASRSGLTLQTISSATALDHRQDRKRNDGLNRDWVSLRYLPSRLGTKNVQEASWPLCDRDRVDWHLINRWYSACLVSHDVNDKGGNIESSSSSHPNYRSHLRVIDVESACVVPCPPDVPYIASELSMGYRSRRSIEEGTYEYHDNTRLLQHHRRPASANHSGCNDHGAAIRIQVPLGRRPVYCTGRCRERY